MTSSGAVMKYIVRSAYSATALAIDRFSIQMETIDPLFQMKLVTLVFYQFQQKKNEMSNLFYYWQFNQIFLGLL